MAEYKNHKIKIVNTWFNGESLFVNDELQDKRLNLFSADLRGHIKNSDGTREIIKVSLGGYFRINCNLFIDDKAIPLTQIE